MVTRSTSASNASLLQIASLVALAALALPSVARADDASDRSTNAPTPQIHHAPPIVRTSGDALAVRARFEHAERVRRALLVYRGASGLREVAFQRAPSAEASYVAVVPAAEVAPPAIAYDIEIEQTDGQRVAAFASREEMHVVRVNEDLADGREREELAALGGRRSVFEGGGEYVYFGATDATVRPGGASSPPQTQSFRDGYFRLEGAYTYRILRTVAEFGIRGGIVRGTSVVPGETDPTKFDVGLNYGAARVRLRLHDMVHVEGELLTSITEVGFSTGGGGALILGDPYGSRLMFGGESIQVFGSRGYMRLDLAAGRRVVLGPILEVTDMPHASRLGMRLLGEAKIDLGAGFGLGVRAGYQARTFASGGPSAGLSASYAF